MREILKAANIDWMKKAPFFLGLSAVLLLVGAISVLTKGGLKYGIDFRGGTLVYVRFDKTPPVDKIRAALHSRGLGDSSIQSISDPTRPGTNEVVIGLDLSRTREESLDAGKNLIIETLRSAFPTSDPGKPDFNSATSDAVLAVLARRDPLGLAGSGGQRYAELTQDILSFRDAERSGLVADFAQLRSVEGVNDATVSALQDAFSLGQFVVRNVEIVGPKVGEQLRRQAVLVTLYALAGMLLYIAFRFEWVYGGAAVLAVFHDVLITLGFFSLLNYEISLTVIAALLTLVGYSMNDTIVIFDRIRENLRTMRRDPFEVIVNRSLNQTLSRTLLTSGLTFLTVLVLYLLGGEVLRSFAFALVVGIVIGTYSSVGFAAPLVVYWYRWRGHSPVTGMPQRAAESAGARSGK